MPDAPITLRERIEHRIARVLLRLPNALLIPLSGGRRIVRDGQQLHPELQFVLRMRELQRMSPLSAHPPHESRRRLRREALVHVGEVVKVGAVRDLVSDGADGPLQARHYAPLQSANGPEPLLVFLHGGGFVVGDLDTHDSACRLLCRHAGVHVLSVDYRLAPEHPFPAAVEDALASFRWARANAGQLGADPSRIAIGGDSAGGNLAAVVAQETKRNGEPAPIAQLLLYPATDRTVRRPSLDLFAEGFFLTDADMDYFLDHYAGPKDHPRVCPLLATDLSNLPPALVVTAGFDPLRDEGEAYAHALQKAGTETVLRRFDGFIHGFVNMAGVSPACREAVIEIAGSLRAMLGTAQRGQATFGTPASTPSSPSGGIHMAGKKQGGKQQEKKYPSGDRSGEGRPARDDHVFPEDGGRNEFGTHGGPHHEGGGRQAPSKSEEEK